MRLELLQQARLAARGIPVETIAQLSGSENDVGTFPYERLKVLLGEIRGAKPNCRFLYLMGRKPDGRVFFYVDSLSRQSADYAPPGLVYNEVPSSYLPGFESGSEVVVGPIHDRWGTLVTALIPIFTAGSDQPVAVLGMDVTASNWSREIVSRCVGFSLISVLLIVVTFLLASKEEMFEKLQESEAKLQDIVNNSTNLFYSHTVDHVLTYMSPQSQPYLQCEPDEAMRRWTEFVTDHPMNEEGLEWTQKAIETGCSQKPYELELVGKKGKKIVVEVNETPILKEGKTVKIVGSLTDITDRKKAEEALLEERDNLKKALAEIDVLQGVIPICAVCKKIRDDEGYWNQLETYLSLHSSVNFSHGVCPDCARQLYPDVDFAGD